ncbi:DNA repair protein RecO [Mycoplasmopsis agassizii]|uniref:DNA repair protein RecO n=1 Tax=Mycoplasmopsis agassizii TaxID=33922 RepID=UPI003527DB89
MATTIKSGILLKIVPHNQKDGIIKVLFEKEIISMISRGILQVNSKNRLNLIEGSVIEFEYFAARLVTSLSKLKTAHLITRYDQQTSFNLIFWPIVLVLLNQLEQTNSELYNFILLLLNFTNETKAIYLFVYLFFLLSKPFGFEMNFHSCVVCDSYKKIIFLDITKGGFVCALHSLEKTELNLLKGFHSLEKSFSEFLETTSQATTLKMLRIFVDLFRLQGVYVPAEIKLFY